MKTRKKTPPEPGVTIRFASKAQIAVIKRAAAHMDMSFNCFVRTTAEASAQWMLAQGKADIFVNASSNANAVRKHSHSGA
jgi:hypothetical protein